MREETPELYGIYVDALQKSVEADFIQRTHPYTEPLKTLTLAANMVLLLSLWSWQLPHMPFT